MRQILLLALVVVLFPPVSRAAKTLDMYAIDTEGGKALLIIAPSGQSMLIDTGNTGNNDRDLNRIVEAAKAAGVKKFDVLVTTHYDSDHVNNTPAVVSRIPAALFVDHGPAAFANDRMNKAVAAYLEVTAKAKRMVVKPGDKIPFKGIDVLVLTSNGEAIKTPLKGAGAPNSACADTPQKQVDKSENGYSIGLLFTYGKFRMADFGDLSWNRELELMCPANPVGTVDLFMVSYHGGDPANSPALIHGLRPRVTVMDNGIKKMGTASVLETIKTSPGLEAAYQLHWSINAPNTNPPDEFIANLQNSTDGNPIKVSAQKNGVFMVTNTRTGTSKTFRK
jgi:beta-lactamase superfamily II metal-dependent hydrolase